MQKPKTLEDFPHFTVAAVRRGETSETGYTQFELDGKFDRPIERIEEFSWFWLISGQRDYFCATPVSVDKETLRATLSCDEKDEPPHLGQKLAYMSNYWQGYHIAMVLDPSWGWEKKLFHATDAVAEQIQAGDASVENGGEIKTWTTLERAEDRPDVIHLYPVNEDGSPSSSGPRLIPGGWDHEHCEFCNAHVDPGMFGYCDAMERWMCVACYERYVEQRDLAFVDEL